MTVPAVLRALLLVIAGVTRSDAETCENATTPFCVQSCCPEGENIVNRQCDVANFPWTPRFYLDDGTITSADPTNLTVVDGFVPDCEFGKTQVSFNPYAHPSLELRLHSSGTLEISTEPSNSVNVGHDYCFYNVETEGRVLESIRACVPVDVPQISGLPNIEDVPAVPVAKCCKMGQMWDIKDANFVCVNTSSTWQPVLLHGDPTRLIQLPPDKANISASGDFQCPEETNPSYLSSTADNLNFLLSTGQLHIPVYNVTVEPGRFCQERLLSSGSRPPQPITRVCYGKATKHTKDQYETLCPTGVCARKCCDPMFYFNNYSCIPTKEQWQPQFHQGSEPVEEELDHKLIHGQAECSDGYNFIFSSRLSPEDTPFLQTNGEVHIPKLNITFKPHQCCMEYERYYDEDELTFKIAEVAICCHPKDEENIIRSTVYSILLLISAICLFVMLAIYMLVPKLRNIHGKCLMSHAAALFVSFSLTVYNHFVGVALGPNCDAMGMLLYYSFLAALFWLNAMSFDIWWTFAHLRTRAPSKRSLRNRFIRHSLYSWGVPLLMTAILAFLNYAPDSILPPGSIVRPDLGTRKCFLSYPRTELYYFYIPIFVVTVVNVGFFVATAYALFKAEESARVLQRKRTARDRFKVYVNLFVIMEVSWIAECLSSQLGPVQLWYLTDVINASQGTLIFLLFILRPSNRKAIKERCQELRGVYNRKVYPTTNPQQEPKPRNTSPTKTTTVTNSSSGRKSSEADGIQMNKLENTANPQENGANASAQTDRPRPEDGATVNGHGSNLAPEVRPR